MLAARQTKRRLRSGVAAVSALGRDLVPVRGQDASAGGTFSLDDPASAFIGEAPSLVERFKAFLASRPGIESVVFSERLRPDPRTPWQTEVPLNAYGGIVDDPYGWQAIPWTTTWVEWNISGQYWSDWGDDDFPE